MPVDLPLLPLGSWFPHDSWPQLPCGSCDTGYLQIGEPREVDVAERYRGHEAWEPYWIQGHFTVEAECVNQACGSITLLAGKMKVDDDVDDRGHWHGEYTAFYELKYAEPSLRLLVIPKDAPDGVKILIQSAAQVIWMSAAGAANRLRAAIEELLTHLNVPEGPSTHKRIEQLSVSRPDVAQVLEAVKWIGNEGSHAGALPLESVLEGSALLERALHLLFDRSGEELDQLAREINMNRGRPRS